MSGFRRFSALPGAAVLIACVSACGGSPTTPSTAPRVTSVTPTAGSTIGGTLITIAGANFSAGATVTIGGNPATQVSVVDANTLTATAPAHDAGTADVTVTVGGQSVSLRGGFTYVVNAPPSISSIVVRGSKPREPPQFADIGEAVSVAATVTDAETPVAQLTFAWSADAGTFSGSGATVAWTAPAGLTSSGSVTLTVTVTEHFQTTNSAGVPVSGENLTKGTTTVHLHNSQKEVGDLAVDFLTAFSQQMDPLFVVRNFTTTCAGRADELTDVEHNQVDFTITSWKVGTADTRILFTGTCPFPGRIVQGDGCAYVPAEWHSLVKSATYHPELKPYIGKTMNVSGTDLVSAVLENDQWKLCGSNWDQAAPATFTSVRGEVIPTSIRFKR